MEQSFFAKVGALTDKAEETLIAFFLGAMTLLTFINVIMRYLFNDNILWALELTVYKFVCVCTLIFLSPFHPTFRPICFN